MLIHLKTFQTILGIGGALTDASAETFYKRPKDALEDCELLSFNPVTKEMLLTEIPKFERVFRLMVQHRLAATQNRLINTISKPAQQKYLDFIQSYPTIPQRVPQHYIASYLGISPEFLSKVWAKLSKK